MKRSELGDEDRLVDAVKRYTELLDSGKAPSHEEYLRCHADIAHELLPALEGLALVHRAGSPVNVQPPVGSVNSPSQELSGKPIGDFQIIREIGRGGMGVVYEATQLSLNRRVALKVLPLASGLDEVRLQRFRNEANAAATLHHTNIVPVFAVGSDRGVHFYAMQLIDGITLSDLLDNTRESTGEDPRYAATMLSSEYADGSQQRTEQRVERSEVRSQTAAKYTTLRGSESGRKTEYYRSVVRMIQQAARAIDHAHQYGVIHRDIKPANLLLDHFGKIWVADFGLAQIQSDQSNLTRTGDPMGTLRYMSPEQATGKRGELNHRTDIYSLGVTLYELLTLKPAIGDGDFRQMLNHVALVEPPTPRSIDPSLPIELDTIVRKASAKIPAERYATAGEFADDLQAWLDDKPISAKPPTLIDRMVKWRRRNSGLVAASSLVLLLATVGLSITSLMIWNQKQQTTQALSRETKQRELAEQQFELARRAVDTFSRQSENELSHRGGMQELRRSFLETSLGFYQHFLNDSTDNSKLSADLLATRDRVLETVRELRILDDVRALVEVRDVRVQKEITLTSDQASTILNTIDQFERQRSSLANPYLGGLGADNPELSELLRWFEQAVSQLLSSEQRYRLHQISLQNRLPLAFKSSTVINRLALTTDQVEQVDRIIEKAGPLGGPPQRGPGAGGPGFGGSGRGGPGGGGPGGGGPGGGGPGGGRPGGGPGFGGPPPRVEEPPGAGGRINAQNVEQIAEAKARAVSEILSLLTPKQLRVWNELVGQPFPDATIDGGN